MSSSDEVLDKALHEACMQLDVEEVAKLLDAGADPNSLLEVKGVFSTYTISPLMSVIKRATGDRNKSIAIMKLLLNARADPNYQDLDGDTAAHVAAHHGFHMGIKLLVHHGGDLTRRNRVERLPLDIARFQFDEWGNHRYGETYFLIKDLTENPLPLTSTCQITMRKNRVDEGDLPSALTQFNP